MTQALAGTSTEPRCALLHQEALLSNVCPHNSTGAAVPEATAEVYMGADQNVLIES